jgi:hypothetical protein
VQAVNHLKSQGSTVIITTHRPRLIGAVDNLLVLRNGAQVGFGPADDMINAVRNLQVVSQGGDKGTQADADDAVVKEGTNDQPIATEADDFSVQNQDNSVQAEDTSKPANPGNPGGKE